MATTDDKKIIFSMVGLSKTIKQTNKQVLKDIYLSFFYGAKIGIIGLNGSGKSTLLKIIAGIDKSYQGEVVFSPGYSVGYLECGAVNNSKKQIHRGKTVTTFAYGSKRIYDFVDDNPAMEILPVDYVNDPNVICKNDNMISINAAIEVDFFGQVCAESVGTKHMSGSGGQIDFVRGACQSKGGKSFIAFTSTAKGGTISKIKPILTPGAVCTTSKNDVDYIVTEYGIAHLRGRSLGERTRQLIAIAHPDFRDELTFEAKKRGIII